MTDNELNQIMMPLIKGEIDDTEAMRLMIFHMGEDFEFTEDEIVKLWNGMLAEYWKEVISTSIKWYEQNARGTMWWNDVLEGHGIEVIE